MIRRLTEHGYLRVEQVAEPGEFAVRGAVLDVFPTGSTEPIRIDLFDDEIESLRTFDPQTQLSAGKIDSIRILPAREFPFDDAAIKSFRERFREQFPVDPSRCPVYRTISEAQLPAGIEYYLPLFFAATVSLLDYLGKDALVVVAEDALAGLDEAWSLVAERYEQLRGDIEQPILAPAPRLLRAGRAPRADRASAARSRCSHARRPTRRSPAAARSTPASRIRSRAASRHPTTGSRAGSEPTAASARCSRRRRPGTAR